MYKYNMGGSVPRETNIGGQRHSLAYINPFEEDLLNTQYRGGEGQPMPPVPGPGGIPAYRGRGALDPRDFGDTTAARTSYAEDRGTRDSPNNDRDERNAAANRQAAETLIAAALADAENNREKGIAPATNVSVGGGRGDGAAEVARRNADAAIAQAANNREDNIAPAAAVAPSVNVGPQGPLAPEVSVRPKIGRGTPERDGIMGIVDDIVRGGKTILSDIRMGITANPFGSPEQQRANLKEAGYSDFEIDEYFLATAESQERMKNQPIFRDDDKDMTAAVIDDPCPEGYKLDPITNQCVMDDTIDVLNPGGQQVTDFVMPSVNPVIGQAANYTGAVAPMNAPMPLQPYAPGTSGNLLQSSAPGLARTRAGGIMGL